MLESIVLYSLIIFFVFFLVNYAEIFDRPRKAILPLFPVLVRKSLTCAVCFTFWASVGLFFMGFAGVYMLASPPFVMLLNSAYLYLNRKK